MSARFLMCSFVSTLLFSTNSFADDWPQWMGPQRDGIWRETGIISRIPESGPKYVWRTPIAAGYAGPAVSGGRVYVHDRKPNDGVEVPKSGFARGQIACEERVHCLDADSGKVIWTHADPMTYSISYASGPRCTPLVSDGRVLTLGAMGLLSCLDTANGKPVWQKDLAKEYSAKPQVWGFSAHPLLDGNKLICLVGGEASVVAFHKDTGKELWRSMSVRNPGYCPPVIFKVGDQRQLIVWHPEAVNGLDPETGSILWSFPFKLHQSALSIPMPRLDGDRLFITSFYNGPLMLRLAGNPPRADLVWKGKSNSERADRTDILHSIMPTPVIKDGHIYGVCSYGQLRCINAETAERVWETMKATRRRNEDGAMVPADAKPKDGDRWGNAFLTPQGDRYWLFNEHGDLILAKLSPAGYEEMGRMNILIPDNQMANHPVVWSHPAFANKRVYARNDSEIVCVDLMESR